ncbi:MAG: DUF721 domain-containing protein [Cyanobacteria bacterium SIG30]|nr:DUF721 domain-containing protein [Cyanobacteria bacterium SIG30]
MREDFDFNYNSIGNILGSTFQGGAEYSNTSKTAVFFSFWPDIVGSKFSSFSKPYSLKSNKLFVVCKNSFVSQEISMYKKDILKKTSVYAKGIGLEINDIVFSYKNWNDLNKTFEDDLDEENSEIDFSDDIYVDEEKIYKILSENKFLDDNLKKKFAENIIKSVKAKSLRNNP